MHLHLTFASTIVRTYVSFQFEAVEPPWPTGVCTAINQSPLTCLLNLAHASLPGPSLSNTYDTCNRQLGGYKEWPLMEDVDLVERMRALEPPAIVPQPVTVSNRRWLRLGLVRTTLINQRILRAWKRGVPPEALAVLYRESFRQADASRKRVQ